MPLLSRHMLTRLCGFILTSFILMVSISSAANAADRYGAIAYDERTGAVGYSHDYGTRRNAEQRALQECQGNCSVKVWFKNACGALAHWRGQNGGYAYGFGWNQNLGPAKNRALSECRTRAKGNCTIRAWACNGG